MEIYGDRAHGSIYEMGNFSLSETNPTFLSISFFELIVATWLLLTVNGVEYLEVAPKVCDLRFPL